MYDNSGHKHINAYDYMEQLYERWANMALLYDNPTRGQKAALTRAWHEFETLAWALGYDPHVLSKKWSEP